MSYILSIYFYPDGPGHSPLNAQTTLPEPARAGWMFTEGSFNENPSENQARVKRLETGLHRVNFGRNYKVLARAS